jgi:hypothetical protein
LIKTIKKYKWWIVGGIGLFVVYHFFIKRAYIGNDPNTGIAGKDAFHLYAVCKDGVIMGRCVNPDGTSCTGDPCQDAGNLDATPQFKGLNIMSPGGEMIIRQAANRPLGMPGT